MKGFFYQTESKKRGKSARVGSKKMNSPRVSRYDCLSCGLYKNCISPKMPVSGNGKDEVLFVAEAPGKKEDKQGIQLIGRAGTLLRKYLKRLDFDLYEQAWKTNAVICRPVKNNTPTTKQINCCKSNLMETIEKLKPKKIIVLGKVALQSLLGNKINDLSIEKWVGRCIPDQDLKCWVFPTWHPSYLLRNEQDIVLEKYFISHLEQAVLHNDIFPINYPKPEIITTQEGSEIFLESLLLFKGIIAIDYETTGLRPYSRGHQIICMSICTETKSVSFPIFYNDSFLMKLRKVLRNSKIKKVAHNISYEDLWTKEILGYNIKGWHWDTMVEAHIQDNRHRIAGLKFQTYVNYGIVGYDSSIKSYLEIKGKDINGINNVLNASMDDLLLYNGWDAFFTYQLFLKQQSKLQLPKRNDLFQDGIIELSKVSQNGICVDKNYYNDCEKELSRKIFITENRIQGSKEIEKFGKSFNPDSTKDMKELFFDVLKYDPVKKTKKGNPSLDQSALEEMKGSLVKLILKRRKLKKIKDTYLAQFIRGEVNGKIYTNFNLHIVRSFRSSSSDPNLQNIPKRDDLAQKTIRTGVVPSEGNQLLEVDYSGIEVRISTCYHHDPVMINYIEDSSTDMHRDSAMELFLMKKDQVSKNNRYLAKNNFVFPQFYGDYYVNCATALWNKIDKDTKIHLKENGILNYRKFENHVKKVENDFWYKRFKVYTKWKDKTWQEYQKNGYIDLYTGFRCKGVMRKNEVLNFPIQGTAFHCLLWSLIQLNRYLDMNKFKSKIIGQIHDSIIFDICPDELQFLKIKIREVMCEEIRKYWKWIIVPLDIEAEISVVDGNWAEMYPEKI